MKRRVVKVGGSLLQQQHFGENLRAWLAANADMQNILIVGGGSVADLVRQHGRILGEEASHALALGAMQFTASLVSHIVNRQDVCREFDRLQQIVDPHVVFDSLDWILKQPDVPASWDFTSDSVAARLATALSADELVLLKSRKGRLDERGFVDACFAAESRSVDTIRVGTLDT